MTNLYDKLDEIKQNPLSYQGKLVKSRYWPEIMEIIFITPMENTINCAFSTLDKNIYSPKMFNIDELKEIEIIDQDFGGNSNNFFLAMAGYIIRNNYELDPYFAVGISKIDPLPHQLDAVYNYILPRGVLRFMIADDPGAGKTIMAGLVIKEYI